MNIGIYIEMNVLSCLLCMLLFYQQRKHKVFDFLGTTEFNSILWCAVCILLVDAVSWLMVGGILPHTDESLMFIQSIYYLLQSVIPLFFFMYCLDTSGIPVQSIWKSLMLIPVLYTAGALALNFTGKFAFYIVESSVKRGAGFIAVVLAPMIYVINSLILCIVFCFRNRRISEEKFKVSVHMLVCISTSFLGAVACVFVSYLNPWHVFIFSLLYLYIQLHGFREHDLDALAFTDSLTGLRTHAAYTRIKGKINEELLEDQTIKFAVVMADIDYLKRVNDTYGHEAGNALIISAAQLICDTFQHSPVYRIGGDEFVAILRKSDYENREALCKQFAEQMEKTTFLTAEGELPVSVSFGIADYQPEYHATFDAVFHAADEAMYENKTQVKTDTVNA